MTPNDVKVLKDAFNGLGAFDMGIKRRPGDASEDSKLRAAICGFQRAHGLKADCEVTPHGPTLKTLRQAAAESSETAQLPAKPGADGAPPTPVPHDPLFERHLERLIRTREGAEPVDHPEDPGGLTYKGVSQRYYNAYLAENPEMKRKLPARVTDLRGRFERG